MKPSYRIAELEKIVDAFRQRAFEAERERDELKHIQELNVKIKQAMHERFTRAEAEIARRDAAAGEPDGYIFCHPSGKNFWSVSHPDNAGHNGVKPFYFAAPPAVLPPDWYFQLTFEIPGLDNMTPYQAHGAAWKQCSERAKSLGAQPQKPVTLPNGCGDRYAWSDGVNNLLSDIKSALEAANVPYEVKK